MGVGTCSYPPPVRVPPHRSSRLLRSSPGGTLAGARLLSVRVTHPGDGEGGMLVLGVTNR